jgi:hypothetical protein
VTFGGFILATTGMLLLTQLSATSSYWPNILPALIIISLGMGLIFVPLSATALFAVGNHDAGVASAVLNTSQQIGGSIGIAFLNTIATSATAAYVIANNVDPFDANAQVEGYVDAFMWSAGILALAGIIWVSLVRVSKKDMAAGDSAVAVHV